MCMLGPVLSCDCYAFSGMTDFVLLFFPVLLQRGGYTHMFVRNSVDSARSGAGGYFCVANCIRSLSEDL